MDLIIAVLLIEVILPIALGAFLGLVGLALLHLAYGRH
jgi:hypothetical protein